MNVELATHEQPPNSDEILKQLAKLLVVSQVLLTDFGPIAELGFGPKDWETLHHYFQQEIEKHILSGKQDILAAAIKENLAQINHLYSKLEWAEVRHLDQVAGRSEKQAQLMEEWNSFLEQAVKILK